MVRRSRTKSNLAIFSATCLAALRRVLPGGVLLQGTGQSFLAE
jgi:hypothetical protein